MDIQLTDLGKKFYREWIFRHLDLQISGGEKVAITGANGSGKSTLLKIISNYHTPSEGKIRYGQRPAEDIQLRFSFAAPYVNLPEEFTLTELLHFHGQFKEKLESTEEILAVSGLEGAQHKLISEFSSGMKQRVRLSLAFFFRADVLFLDEPTTNLDKNGISWYQMQLEKLSPGVTLFIASNQPGEYEICKKTIEMENFKK